LDENDSIDVVYGLQEVLGNVVGWNTDTLIKVTKKIVKRKNSKINKGIKRMGGRNRNKVIKTTN